MFPLMSHVHDGYYWVLHWLVVSIPLKNMKVNGKDDPIYYLYYGKYKVFETTNQINYIDPARGVSQPQATASPTKSTWEQTRLEPRLNPQKSPDARNADGDMW